MKTIDFKVAGKLYSYNIPENWEELTQQQFVIFAGGITDSPTLNAETVRRLIGLDDVVTINLTPADWWRVVHEFDWMTRLDEYKTGKMDSVTLCDGTICIGFSDDFSDVTWQEWMIADSNAYAGRWDVVAAVLYRPQKDSWDHQSNPRGEFSQWDCETRLPMFQQLEKDVLSAVTLNYKLMRRKLTTRYRRLFSGGGNGNGSDLQTLIRNVMGDNFFEEDKYLKLSVPSVLFQLDRMVREERERRRNARTN